MTTPELVASHRREYHPAVEKRSTAWKRSQGRSGSAAVIVLSNLDGALREYDLAEKSRSDDPQLCLLRADVLSKQNRRGAAIQSLREAIRLRPGYWEAHYRLGAELALAGNYLEAQAQFEELVRLRPEDPSSHFNLAIALARQQRLDEAIAQFQETVRLDPGHQQARQMLQTVSQLRAQHASSPDRQH